MRLSCSNQNAPSRFMSIDPLDSLRCLCYFERRCKYCKKGTKGDKGERIAAWLKELPTNRHQELAMDALTMLDVLQIALACTIALPCTILAMVGRARRPGAPRS
jgi:hypothetical protein